MRIKMVVVFGMIILVGLVSAGLVDFLSNMVTGSVEVRGPVFYIDYRATQRETIYSPLGDKVKSYLLSLEQTPSTHNFPDILINCTEAMGGCEAKFMQFFTTKELGIDYFYNSNWKFYTNLKVINRTNPNGNCSTYSKLFKMHEESGAGIYDLLVNGRNNPTDIIPVKGHTGSFEDMISEFNLPYTEMLPKDRFYVEYWIICDYGEYNLKFRVGQDKTRIEITAA